MFQTWQDYYYFKYVPAAFRGLGAVHRRALRQASYGSYQFFGQVGALHIAALNRALPTSGGVAGLRF